MNLFLKYAFLLLLIGLLVVIPEYLIFGENHSWCILKNLTGIECPLCGMTRACYLLLTLKIRTAIAFNPLVIILPLLLLLEILTDISKAPLITRIRKMAWIALGAGLLTLFALRFFESVRL